ncbi:MAG: hypothetical protein QF362_03960 [Candidatus Woesearchaeota archaeon]|jgi:hypothetical protein|nr:hypothetical protein [Candidatus Woesearchaeota archaeon]MDP7506570.1 hypothetical protein [Candidatus Woesearchaeota archaeon]|tara:strand:+ start:3540 stop:3950 length:411 start_codon:yes stop_codon:yes gene_type:complete
MGFEKLVFGLFVLFLLALAANAIPGPPMIVIGSVYINEKPAEVGTMVTAEVNGEKIVGFSVVTEGEYHIFLQELKNNDEVKFSIDGISTGAVIKYKSNGLENLDISVKKPNYYIPVGMAVLIIGLFLWKNLKGGKL